MTTLMTRDQYDRWWQDNTDEGGELLPLDEPAATLAAHVMALQGRIDRLMDPDEHDKVHGRDCRCMASRCACAYDHPDAVCVFHAEHHARLAGDSGEEG
jgi:hypothetical protein